MTVGIGVFVALRGGVRVTVGCGVDVGDPEVQPIKNEKTKANATTALALGDNFTAFPPIAGFV